MEVLDELGALALIDQGARLAPLDRAVLLAARFGGTSQDEACDLPLDRRDALLVDARIAAFGSKLTFFARCGHCAEGSEAAFDLASLPTAQGPPEAEAEVAGKSIRLRAPTSREVAVAVLSGRPGDLLQACLAEHPTSDESAAGALLEEALTQAFPLLDVRLGLTCPACERPFDIRFDIATWLWAEIETLAHRALDEVHRLARAYGWSETEILSLSIVRRSQYLARVA